MNKEKTFRQLSLKCLISSANLCRRKLGFFWECLCLRVKDHTVRVVTAPPSPHAGIVTASSLSHPSPKSHSLPCFCFSFSGNPMPLTKAFNLSTQLSQDQAATFLPILNFFFLRLSAFTFNTHLSEGCCPPLSNFFWGHREKCLFFSKSGFYPCPS